ncbi:MAG: ABC transporter substrate-binding protein [SAR324 cluster bacterium]|nr:ABC transporter substrate-binding protein [SAR324 cluster bacterium]
MASNKLVLFCAALLVAVLAFGAPASAQKRGGILNWFIYADPARLDIHTESPLAVQQATAGVYSGLLHWDPNNPKKIAPDLATDWFAFDGGKTYLFNLRRGVKWHDGKPFTAKDVAATFNRIIDPAVKSKRCGSLLRPLITRKFSKKKNKWITGVKVLGTYQVRFSLNYAAATFLPSIASAWCRVAAAHILKRDGNLLQAKSQIGTGPFMFKRYERGVVVEWERNPNYYNPKLPYLDGVKQFILKGGNRQLAAAKAGKIHVWDTWPPMSKSKADELKNARGDKVRLYTHAINVAWQIHFNTTRKPFSIKDMRRAVHLGLDRKELYKKAFEGIGTPCAILDPSLYGDWALPMSELAKIPGCRQDKKAEDIAEAKRLVKKHYPNGVEIVLAVRTVGNYLDRVQLVAAQLRKLGIKPNLKTYESAAGYVAWGKGEFDLIGTQDTAMFVPDPSAPFSILFTSDAGRNWGKWVDKYVDEMAAKGLRESDQVKRRKIYHDLQRYILTQDSQTAAVGWVEGWFFTDSRVRNYNPANTVYDNNTFMTVWLDQ